jgi:hypothetical protein
MPSTTAPYPFFGCFSSYLSVALGSKRVLGTKSTPGTRQRRSGWPKKAPDTNRALETKRTLGSVSLGHLPVTPPLGFSIKASIGPSLKFLKKLHNMQTKKIAYNDIKQPCPKFVYCVHKELQ